MGSITVVGVGWRRGQLTLEAAEALTGGARVVLHTERCACAKWLREKGIAFETLDGLYDEYEDFDEHAAAAAKAVMQAARDGDVVYGVMDVRDRSVIRLMAEAETLPAVLAGPPAEGALLALVSGEARCVEASDWEDFHLTAREHCFVREIDSRELACEVKLRLMEVYPEESEIWFIAGDAAPVKLPLYALDRVEGFDHRACALIPAQRDLMKLERYDAEHLNELLRRLCAPDGCPWDRVQTHESLRPYIIEEAYEVIDAIDEQDPDHLYDELGDMLLQVALHAEIGRKHGEFDITDVTTAICRKMLHRHTHVFGRDRADNAEEVLGLWSRNKMAERGQKTVAEAMRDITRALPATLRAAKVVKRAAEVGVQPEGDDALTEACRQALEREDGLGEALFYLCALAKRRGVDPELALNAATEKFVRRFAAAEAEMREKGLDFADLGPERLRIYWGLVKL